MRYEEAHKLLPEIFVNWLKKKKWKPHTHQLEMLEKYNKGISTLLIAPTGGGKTLAGFLPSMVELYEKPFKGLHTIYISPLKALANDIERNLAIPVQEMQLPISIELRTGDTSSYRRQKQFKKPPNILLTTPESMEIILSNKDSAEILKNLKRIIIDEVHSLAPGKRGHLTALCITKLKALQPDLKITGLSATIAKPEQFAEWLGKDTEIIHTRTKIKPKVSIVAKKRVPWSGYTANYAIEEIYNQISKANTAIVFVNTRAQAELLFQKLWQVNEKSFPIALHHGSLEREHRQKVEGMMSRGELRAIVATASLDMGIDWGDVDLVIHVGAPKGISRLIQRIGRSNHRIDEPSEAILIPCNRFEIIESVALLEALDENVIDGDELLPGTLDVLAQFVMNSSCAGGFIFEELFHQVTSCYAYRHIDLETFKEVVRFVSDGGYSLDSYDRFKRIFLNEKGRWEATRDAAKRHRMNTGAIVEYETLRVQLRKFKSRKPRDIGSIEEYFIQGLKSGDSFIFAGQLLQYVGIKDNKVEVEPGKGERPKIPSFKGGKLPLSPSLADRVKRVISTPEKWNELPKAIGNWLKFQQEKSILPSNDYLLTESFTYERLEHLVIYSFAGRNANQTLGLLVSQQMEAMNLKPLGFVANDYAVTFWGLKSVTNPSQILHKALTEANSEKWIESSQMARRAFREIAVISGLIERRHPGKRKTGNQVTISTDLIYDVLNKYEPDHILLRATRNDVYGKLTDIQRLKDIILNLEVKHQMLDKVSPLAIPMILEIGIEKIKDGQGELELLDSAGLENKGDMLLKEAVE